MDIKLWLAHDEESRQAIKLTNKNQKKKKIDKGSRSS